MTLVYMTGRDQPLEFDTPALAEIGLRAMGFAPRTGQPRQWVCLHPDGNLFASMVDPKTIAPG